MKLFVKILLFVFVALITNVKVTSATITFSNIQKKANSNLFHVQIAKTEFKFSENDLENCCQNQQALLDYRDWGLEVEVNAAKGETYISMQQQIQSVTNVYTLQGWIKGIVPGDDPNALIAKQAFNYGLGYFTNDYTPIGSISDPFVSLNKGNDLYNGNIKAMLVNIPKVGEPVLHSYKYDQLNRIKEVNNYNNYSSSNNTWSATNAHKETLSFDANGNIQTALLNDNATNLPYENFSYNYDAVKKNRLLNIHNSVNNTTSNYEYDEIGNITKDELEGNKEMVWSIYGKLIFMGNRLMSVIQVIPK